ncbi:hypothetical protein JCM8208_003662 [Rhodotorula glutinis]
MSYPPAPSSHHQHHPAPHGWSHGPVASTSTSFPAYEPPHSPVRFAYSRDADPRPALTDPYGHQQHQEHRQPPTSASTLTPPSSFGGFGFRRARSSGALPTLQPAALHEQSLHAYAPFPPSPVSPNYPHGDASGGQQQQQQQRPASALSGWRAPPAESSSRDGWSVGQSTFAHEPTYSSSSGSWAQQQQHQPQTPPPSARFRRTSSAQPSFAAPSSTPSSPSRPGSAYSARASTSLGVHEAAMGYASTKFQHSSPEEINQFLNDMSEILGPDALAALSPTSSAPPPRPFDPRQAPSVNIQPPPPPAKKQATYNVAGVLLDEDEYRAFAESPTSSRQPSPVRASSYDDRAQQGRPQYGGGSTYREPAYAAPSYEAWSGGYLAPSHVEIQRPASAPPTPVLDLEASSSWTQFAPYGSTYQSPVLRSTAAMNRRRGSSFDASSIPRIYSSGLVGLQPLNEDTYSRFNAGLGFDESVQAFEPQQPQRRTPPASAYPPSFRVAPAAYVPPPQPQPQHSSTPPVSPQRPSRQQQAQQQPREQPLRAPQPEPTTPVRRPKPKTSISFLNFSAADSKQLLGGVAPSGSSKKRARDDEHSPAQKKRAT